MKKYLLKWFFASLGMPVVVAIVHPFFQLHEIVVLFFWPSSIFLLALGTGPNEVSQVVNVWSVSVTVNIALYTAIGLISWFVARRQIDGGSKS